MDRLVGRISEEMAQGHVQSVGNEEVVTTPRGDVVLSRGANGSWSLREDDFGSVTPPGGTVREVFKASFGVAEGTRLAAVRENRQGRA